MRKFVVLPDVTCDLSQEIRDYFNVTDYISGYAHINDDSIRTTLDWNTVKRDEFYKTLSNKKNKVSSAPAAPEEYYQIFKKYVEDGYDVLSMSLSSKISATYNIAASAAKRVREEYPDCNIYCFDTTRMSGAFGLLVAYACNMQTQGKSMDEIVGYTRWVPLMILPSLQDVDRYQRVRLSWEILLELSLWVIATPTDTLPFWLR